MAKLTFPNAFSLLYRFFLMPLVDRVAVLKMKKETFFLKRGVKECEVFFVIVGVRSPRSVQDEKYPIDRPFLEVA